MTHGARGRGRAPLLLSAFDKAHSSRIRRSTTTKSGAQVIADDADKSEEMFEESA